MVAGRDTVCPEIILRLRSVDNVKTAVNKATADVTGKKRVTIKGVSQQK